MFTEMQFDVTSLKSQLNSSQYNAVTGFDGPQLVLAGAGSGKTRVLTYKIAALICSKNIYPSQIMAVTFTNKAAGEMKQRVEKILGESIDMRWLGTFHSVCAQVLRIYGDRLGYNSKFTIYDRDDQKRYIKKLLKQEGEGENGISPDVLRFRISDYKNQNKMPKHVRQNAESLEEERIGYLYYKYQEGLVQNNAMDFDDLICQSYRLFQEHPDVTEHFKSHIQYILIDEFQDTNKAQFQLVKMILGEHNNLTVVGDEDQSIYGWRGADITNILNFQKSFPNANKIKLEENYRSSANILGVASSVIKNNSERLDKNVFTNNPPGDKVRLFEQETDLDEAKWVVSQIKNEKIHSNRDTAIFYRTNAQSRVFEDQLRMHQIPYVIVGGIRFYDRKEVKDILAYLHVINNPRDSVSLGRIINVPKRGIGDKTIEYFVDLALSQGISLHESLLRHKELEIKSSVSKKIEPFLNLLMQLVDNVDKMSVSDLVTSVIEESGYREFLENEGSNESLDRLGNIEELVSAAEEFEIRNPEGTLESFLQEISLLTDADTQKSAGQFVTLMTVHSAKGLEFPNVYLTGLEENLFPLTRQSEDNIEEERRLFYVAVTRAEKNLQMSYCRHRRMWGQEVSNPVSRFIQEANKDLMETHLLSSSQFAKPLNRMGGIHYEAVDSDPFPDYDNFENSSPYRQGQKVFHSKYGEGIVVKMEGFGEDSKLVVKFWDGVARKLMVKYAKLSLLD